MYDETNLKTFIYLKKSKRISIRKLEQKIKALHFDDVQDEHFKEIREQIHGNSFLTNFSSSFDLKLVCQIISPSK